MLRFPSLALSWLRTAPLSSAPLIYFAIVTVVFCLAVMWVRL